MLFKNWLLENEEIPNRWIDPDYFYKYNPSKAITFIYTIEGNLFTDTGNIEHSKLISKNDFLTMKYLEIHKKDLEIGDITILKSHGRDIAIAHKDLVGRIGLYPYINPQIEIISFWNHSNYESLQNCLNKMKEENLIGENNWTYISTPTNGTTPISGNLKQKEITPEMKAKVELYKQLHTMRGNAKKDAMEKLGVGVQGKKPWQREMEKANIINPSQKYWAISSESKV